MEGERRERTREGERRERGVGAREKKKKKHFLSGLAGVPFFPWLPPEAFYKTCVADMLTDCSVKC